MGVATERRLDRGRADERGRLPTTETLFRTPEVAVTVHELLTEAPAAAVKLFEETLNAKFSVEEDTRVMVLPYGASIEFNPTAAEETERAVLHVEGAHYGDPSQTVSLIDTGILPTSNREGLELVFPRDPLLDRNVHAIILEEDSMQVKTFSPNSFARKGSGDKRVGERIEERVADILHRKQADRSFQKRLKKGTAYNMPQSR